MRVHVSTPNRVDLAGGTLDIWPLYAFLGGGYTVNAAIEMRSEVTVTTRDDGAFDLFADDLQQGETATSLEELTPGGPMDLIVRALNVMRPLCGLDVRTRCTAPKGTGLGSSSSLLIAFLSALLEIEGRTMDQVDLVDAAANIEAQCISVPTGKQDYWAAVRGGVNAIWFGLNGTTVEPLVVDPAARHELSERLTLVFTGETRFSGTSNWNMIKAYIDDTGVTRGKLLVVRQSSERMRECLLRGDLAQFATALGEEWAARKQLAAGVTTPRIDALMDRAAGAGALASKVCGAGGGGCMISFCKPGARTAVEDALADGGATVLPFAIRDDGIRITHL
jgi:D-glycero-alpha-D-manno-heptose-7-phosphate kinase